MWLLRFVTLVDSVGTGLFLTVSALYLTRELGFSVTEVAGALAAAGFAAFLAAVPLGACGDRLGHRPMWVALCVVQAGAYLVYPFVRSFPLLVVLLVVIALAEVGVSPLRGVYVAVLAGPNNRVRARAYLQAVTNVGFMIGAAGGGLVLQLDGGYDVLLFVNAGSYLVCAIVLTSLPASRGAARGWMLLRDRRYLAIAGLNGLLLTYLAVLTVALPLWIATRTDAPLWTVGALVLINTGLAVAGQVRAGRGAETVAGAAAAIRRAGWALLVACLVFAVSGVPGVPGVVALVVGIVVFTGGELYHSAGAWGVSFGLAPEERRGQYLGAFAMGTRIYDTIGAALVTALTLGVGPWGWVVLGVLYLVLAVTMAAVSERGMMAA